MGNALLAEPERDRREAELRDARVRDRLEHAERLGLLGAGHVRDVGDRSRRHARGSESGQPVGAVALAQARGDEPAMLEQQIDRNATECFGL